MSNKKLMFEKLSSSWEMMKSPRAIALLKLAAAIVGVVHAIDELRSTPARHKKIGFNIE